MTPETASKIGTMLKGGYIVGAILADSVQAAVWPKYADRIFVNRASSIGNTFFAPNLGTVLVHEYGHVWDFMGMTSAKADSSYKAHKGFHDAVADAYEVSHYICKRT